MSKVKMSVVIPVYGCRDALEELCSRLKDSLLKITNQYEIILVNDHCPQNSWETICKLCKKDKKIKGIELSRNFGQMKAILAGLDESQGDYVVVMDCDLQDRPEEIPKLYNKLQEGYDMVFAKRKSRQDKKLKVILANLFYKIYGFAVGQKYDPEVCNFSVIRRDVVDAYCRMREEHRAYVIYLQWLGFKRAYIPVKHDPRKSGKSSYSLKKRIKFAAEILLSQSDKFLKLIVKFGILISFLSLIAIAIIIIIHLFFQPQASGWVSIIATICLVGGINTSVIGIVGLYVGNVFIQVKERPLYIIRSIKNKEDKK